MWHLDHDVFDVAANAKRVFKAPIISCSRHFVPKVDKSGFIEKEDEEKEEWVFFSGFESVENHMEFANTEGFGKYSEIMGLVSGFEFKHLKGVEGL